MAIELYVGLSKMRKYFGYRSLSGMDTSSDVWMVWIGMFVKLKTETS